jgi:hypothetical protein
MLLERVMASMVQPYGDRCLLGDMVFLGTGRILPR